MDMQQWDNSMQILLNQSLPIEYVFDVSSEEDCQQTEQLIERFGIEKYQLNPVYTENNIGFFKEKRFLNKRRYFIIPIIHKRYIFTPSDEYLRFWENQYYA